MREAEFEDWLSNVYVTRGGARMGQGSRRSMLSNCRTVERHEGDLHAHAQRDGMKTLLERFVYRTRDHAAGSEPRHNVPMGGNPYTQTATFKRAVRLYAQFEREWPAGGTRPESTSAPAATPRARSNVKGQATWPRWEVPKDEDLLPQARLIARFTRFLHPDIAEAVAQDNDAHREAWVASLEELGIAWSGWLWPGSACAFPGIRRYAGSAEIKTYWEGGWKGKGCPPDALLIDDNAYPKHAWSFAMRGRPFQQFGPKGHALAHLLDHKAHGGRLPEELDVPEGADLAAGLPGLYTSPTNAAYVPRGLLRPTDFEGSLRNLLQRRAIELYAGGCSPLPPGFAVKPPRSPEWELDAFEWAEPVGETRRTKRFLHYRNEKMRQLFEQATDRQRH